MRYRFFKLKYFPAVFMIITMIMLFSRCIKETFDPENFDPSLNLAPGLAVPVGFSHLGIEKYINDSLFKDQIRISDDGLISLVYNAPIDSGVVEDILTINNTTINKSVINQTGSVIFLNTPGASLSLSDSIIIPITISYSGGHLDSIRILNGTLRMIMTSSNLTGSVIVRSNGLRLNGVPFITTVNLPNPVINLPLAGYSIIPDHDLSGNNYLKCMISITLVTPSGPVNPGAMVLDLRADLTNLNYETIYGDMSGFKIDFPARNIETPFFSQFEDGEIIFSDPKIKFSFSNSAGVPFGISFSRIDAIDRNNLKHPLTGSGVPTAANPKVIRYPALNQIGQTVTDSLIFDKNNTNLPDFIAVSPDSIGIKASAEIMALSPPATTFLMHDSRYKASVSIELPLKGKADFLIMLDTMDFDYLDSTLPPPEEIEKLIVRTSITNSFPISTYPQIYFLDSNKLLLDSLFTGNEKISGANDTNGDGKSDPQKQPPIDIELPRSKIDNLMNARFLVAKGRIMSTDFPNKVVSLYSTYFLDYNVGIIAQLKIKTGK